MRVGTLRLTLGTEPPRRSALPVLEEHPRGTAFVGLRPRSMVNSPESTGIGCWSVNPYIGCEFGCTYCYARFAHRYTVERAAASAVLPRAAMSQFRGASGWEGFERRIFVKERTAAVAVFERDLPRILARYAQGQRETLLFGTATDPYQPAERTFRVTRALFERLLLAPPLRLGLITKSPLIRRDIPLLLALSRRHRLSLHISLISTSRRYIRLFEARSPGPGARLRVLEQLTAAGLNAGLIVAPILPGVTDSCGNLRRVLQAAKERGARFAHPSPLRLYADVRPVLLPVIERHFPSLAPRYRAAYQGRRDAPAAYRRSLTRRFSRLAAQVGLPTSDALEEDPAEGPPQLGLWSQA